MNDGGPWGDSGETREDRGRTGPRNPWTPPSPEDPKGQGPRGPSAIDELVRRARDSFGGGGLPGSPDGRRIWPLIVGFVLAGAWMLTTFHPIGAKERGIVTFLGSYSRTLEPGVGWTLPAPLEAVSVVNAEEIRNIDLGSAGEESEKLMLTGDQNVINLGYSVRWNISDPKQFLFQIADPEETIREVAESAMRAVIATVTLQSALGAGRNDIELQVQQRMQEILDGYGAGVRIQGVAIKQADPPDAVNEAFKSVSAAQQDADTYVNQANTYAQQLAAQSQGEAAAFDKVFEQYRLSPEVTRRRMYYETMEKILRDTDKTIVETSNVTPYLPLPQVQNTRKPAETTVTTQGGAQ